MKDYDVIIVGAGPGGIFAAYELAKKAPTKRVLLIDKGLPVDKRRCPILEGRIQFCPPANKRRNYAGCYPACGITNGFGGAGAYSDGKFNITTEFGGWLTDYIPASQVLDLIEYVDSINLEHGATTEVTDPTTDKVREIERRAAGAGLKLLRARVRHLGTEENLKILKSIYDYLFGRIYMLFNTRVTDIKVHNGQVEGVNIETNEGETAITADHVILSPGRDGAMWLCNVLKKHGLEMYNNQVDVGVRVETSNVIMSEINEHLYEGKFIFNTSLGTRVRTFCSNPSGHVVIENHSGIINVNGHSYRDPSMGSNNTNFALLVSHIFSEPFNKPNEYAIAISKLANDLSNGGVIIQKYGDVLRNRRSTERRIKEGFIEPTLKEAVPGDLRLVLPSTTMNSIIEMMEALDKITPGIASEHTLLYGVEAKYYSARPRLNNSLETEIEGLYTIGDGAGVSRGISQSAASGVWVARNIINK